MVPIEKRTLPGEPLSWLGILGGQNAEMYPVGSTNVVADVLCSP
jgi:hypothetical protein